MSVSIQQLLLFCLADAGGGFEKVDFEDNVVVFGGVLDDGRVPSLVKRIQLY